MLGFIWRFFAALFDWRLLLRKLFRKRYLDVICVTNMRDKFDKKLFLGNYNPKLGHYNGPRFYLWGTSGRTRAICSLSEDILHANTQAVAKEQCIAAIEYCQEKGAKIILLAASTKRLFGDGQEIKDMFPGLLFTIGDNGTFFLLLSEILRAFNKAGIDKESNICVIGPYGFLGELVVQHLKARGFYNIIGLGSSLSRLENIKSKYQIQISNSFENVGKVDVIVACTHSSQVRITKEKVDLIRKSGKKLLVIDVSEPSNLTKKEYKKCKEVVIRQDAGNGYSPGLKYVLGAITYKMFRLTKGVTFGCFMEALVWHKALKDSHDDFKLRNLNLFNVNDENIKVIAELFSKYQVRIPSPRNYGKKISSFNLNIEPIEIEFGNNGYDEILLEEKAKML